MKRLLAFLLLLAPCALRAQVAVAPLTLPRAQFLSSTGVPLAQGCVTFNATGTSTPQAIYSDSSGLFQLPNPLTLDAAGEADVWMTNTGYDIDAYTGVVGQNCSSQLGSHLWQVKNKNPFSIINQGSNFIVASATSDPSGVPGELGYRSDIPCLRVFTSIWDCVVELTLTQTLSNKTLTTPNISAPVVTGGSFTTPTVNGVQILNSPGTYLSIPNDGTTGTGINRIVKLTGTNAITVATTDTGGAIGICIALCGTNGSANIEHSGSALCAVDAGTITAGDYIQISSTSAGACHDAGSSYPGTGQVIGRALTTASVTVQIDLFGPEIKGGAVGAASGCTNFTPVTVSNTNAGTPLQTCTIAANTLAQGSLLDIEFLGIESEAAGYTLTLATTVGGGTACSTTVTVGAGNNQPWNAYVKFFVLTSGAGGTANMSCGYTSSAAGGGVIGPVGVVGGPTIAVNTTIANAVQVTLTMSVANAGNTVVGQGLKAVIF